MGDQNLILNIYCRKLVSGRVRNPILRVARHALGQFFIVHQNFKRGNVADNIKIKEAAVLLIKILVDSLGFLTATLGAQSF